MMSNITRSQSDALSMKNEMRVTEYRRMNTELEDAKASEQNVSKPDLISKDGDTLEISKPTIPDAVLKGYSEARLKAMFRNNEISRQQYDRAVKTGNDQIKK